MPRGGVVVERALDRVEELVRGGSYTLDDYRGGS